MYFCENADEMWFIHEGSDILKSQFGQIKFNEGDYLIIPEELSIKWNLVLI
jgi:homogentisate 1,2-dioxygenase